MKKVALVLMLFAVATGSALAQMPPVPPANGGYQDGWGMNPTNWTTADGSFSSWGIYDPNYTGAGDNWVVGYTWPGGNPIYITYAPITLQLWVEMYCLQTYRYTTYQWHRLGNLAETVIFTIEGTIASNNGQFISLTKGVDPLTNLWFKGDMFDRHTGPNIPITWIARWGTGLVYGSNLIYEGSVVPHLTTGALTMLIPDPCDHWFQFEGTFHIDYHQPDGYYELVMAGCPAPVL